jgi:3-oxoacyl-[acyl-carrier protein] reductase
MKGRVALITGASKGIGKEIAELFKFSGAKVLTPSHSELDLASNSSVESYASSLTGGIDILVNNAGINLLAGLDELDQEVLKKTLQINLVAPLILTKLLAERMKSNRYGRIVNISSIWSVVAKEGRLAYTASKSALNGATRTLAVELGEHGILVNTIDPGYVNTELTSQNNSSEQLRLIRNNIPLKRLAEPNEIAQIAAFLCSEKNSYMTGQVLVADGGYVCR